MAVGVRKWPSAADITVSVIISPASFLIPSDIRPLRDKTEGVLSIVNKIPWRNHLLPSREITHVRP